MNKLIPLFLVSIVLFTACGPKITKEQHAKLTELQLRVDTIVNDISKIDSSKISQLTDDYFYRKNYIQKKITDTINRATLFKLDKFIQLRKGMGYLRGEYSTIKNNALTTQNQLNDLEHDVENRLVEEKQFDRYYALEKENFDQLKFNSDRLIMASTKMAEEYQKKVEVVDSLINAHKAKINE